MFYSVLIQFRGKAALMANVKDQFGFSIRLGRRRRADGKWMCRERLQEAEACKTQEAMLSGLPSELGRNCDASKAIFFHENLGFLTCAIFEASSKPGVGITRNVYGGGSNKVVPADVSVLHRVVC